MGNSVREMNIWRLMPVHVGLYVLVLKSQINVQKTTARDNLFHSDYAHSNGKGIYQLFKIRSVGKVCGFRKSK